MGNHTGYVLGDRSLHPFGGFGQTDEVQELSPVSVLVPAPCRFGKLDDIIVIKFAGVRIVSQDLAERCDCGCKLHVNRGVCDRTAFLLSAYRLADKLACVFIRQLIADF